MFKHLQTKIMLLLAMILGGMNAYAQTADVSYDFTEGDWTVSNGTLSNGTVSFTGEGDANFKMNGGYFFMGKSGAYINFPIYSQAVSKIVVTGRSGASGSVKMNMFVGETAVSTETTGATGTNSYEIASDYQAAGTQYTLKVTSAHNTQITKIEVYYATGATPTCATPTFNPEAGEVKSGTKVSINCSTTGATIYYTTNGTTPTVDSNVYSNPIEITEETTIKAYAVKANHEDSEVATAVYTIKDVAQVSGYSIDFESDIEAYVDWTFENVGNTNTAITAHGGSKYGANINADGNGVASLTIQTKETVALPNELTCYVSKVSGNTTSSTWTISVSEDGTNWTEVKSSSATDMTKGDWKSITANLSSYNDVYVRISYAGSTAIRAIDDISLTMRDANTKVTPTIVIDATSLTNDLAGENNVSAGKVTAAVMDGQTAVENVSVTWTSSDTSVATIDAATGAVTLIATGTTTLTATFAGNDDYNEASGTYLLTVIDSEGPGSENHPYTVAQALAAITSGSFDENTNYYISGIISQIDEVNTTQYYNATYFISDDGETTTQLEVFRGKFLDNTNFTSSDQIQVGDEVVIYGKLQYYNNVTPEIAQGNYITSLHRKAVRYYLVGSFDEDPWIEHKIEMTKGEGNIYSVEQEFGENTLFKIVKIDEIAGTDPVWYGGETNEQTYGIHSGWYENIQLNAGDQYKNFKIEPAGTYTFTVDADNMKLTVTGWPVPEVKYYLGGNWTENWADGKVELTENSDGTFSCSKQVGNGTRFKFFKTTDGVLSTYGANRQGEDWGVHSEACTNIPLMEAENTAAFVIQMASDNELVFKLNPTNMTFNVTGWPISTDGNMFVKVTSDADFTDGAYLIVNEEAGVAFNGGLETLDAVNNTISVTIGDGKIEANETTKPALFTIVNGGKVTSASGHYIGVSSYSNSLKQDANATLCNNTVSFENGNALISINTGGTDYMTLKYNKDSNQKRFRYYKSGQEDIQLYKLVTLPTATATIAEACTDGTKYYGTYSNESAFILPEGVTASEISVNDGKLNVKDYAPGATVPANTGVMISSATAGEKTFYLTTGGESVLGSSNMLHATGNNGITAAEMAPSDAPDCLYYRLTMHNGTQIGFWWGAAEGAAFDVVANKAYLAVPADAETGSKIQGFTFGNDGDATEIVLNALKGEQNGEMYNLQGQKVGSEYKGIVIKNNKKYMVK